MGGSADLIAADQGVRVGFPEHNKGPFAAAEFLRPGEHTLEYGVEVQRGAQTLGQPGQCLCFPSLALHLGFVLLPRRDIPRNGGGPDDCPVGVPDR